MSEDEQENSFQDEIIDDEGPPVISINNKMDHKTPVAHSLNSLPIPCTNNCGLNIAEDQLETHITEDCPKTMIACSYPDCPAEIPRCEMEQHFRANLHEHLLLMTKIVHDLSKVVNRQAKEILSLQKKQTKYRNYSEFLWKITQFESKRQCPQKNEYIQSPNYSHLHCN